MESIKGLKRTHHCSQLTEKDLGKEVVLMGWVDRRRDHGGVIFIDLRDREGRTQIVFNPEKNKDTHAKAEGLRNEFVVAVKGIVEPRPEGMINEKLPTGKIEVAISEIRLLNMSRTPPVQINEEGGESEEIRLQYRYLDLRRPWIQKNIIGRHHIVQEARRYLSDSGFIEVETPILMKSTPEGARDYLVPSRVNKGTFYALPQSPQTYKQLLMISGFERYFQIARCFRDEDLRADRQPEFTQIDCELSFVESADVMDIFDGMIKKVFKKILDVDIQTPVQKMTYKESMEKYGTDRPDLRYGLKMSEIQDIVTEFKGKGIPFFEKDVDKGGIVKTMHLPAEFANQLSRSAMDGLEKMARSMGASGLGYARIEEGGTWKSPLAKFIKDEQFRLKVMDLSKPETNDILFFQSGPAKTVNTVMDALRQELAKRFELAKEDDYRFVWVTDFPMFEYSEEKKRWTAMHHPFTSPAPSDIPLLESGDLGKVNSDAYDIVLNGNEIGGGSIRIHDSEIQQKVFKALEISEEEAKEKFGFLLDALQYGAPPHGGIAFGLDRMIMLMMGQDSIREVIAFPKTSTGQSLMDNCPSSASDEQLKELGIRIIK